MVRNFIKKSIDAIISRQTSIFTAAFFIILTTVFSQFLGLVKYRLLVSIFGASSDLGVLLASFRVPDFLFQVLVGGAFSSAFIPVFTEYLSKDKKQEAFSFTSSLMTIGVTGFMIISAFAILFAYQISYLVAPGFSVSELNLMANLTRIILLSQIFFILATATTSILQSFQHFFIPGLAASFYNLGIILSIILFSGSFGIFGAAIGTLVGSIFFFIVQLPILKSVGFRFRLKFKLEEGVVRVFNLMVPRFLTLIVSQFAITANVFFASFISARSLVIYDLAQTLFAAPVLLFGQSIAQASFPSLSLKKENKDEFISIFASSFNQIFYLIIPISALLIVLRIPMVRLFFGASRFDWDATVATGLTLALFAISAPTQGLMYLLVRGFYAHKDAKTPFVTTLISFVVNIGLAYLFILVYKLPIYYLALAFSGGSIVSVVILMYLIDKKIGLPKIQMLMSFIKILTAGIIMGLSLYIPIKLLDQLVFDTTKTINLIFLTGIASFIGFTSYVFFTWLLDIKEAYYIIKMVRMLGDWRKILRQITEPIDGSSSLNP